MTSRQLNIDRYKPIAVRTGRSIKSCVISFDTESKTYILGIDDKVIGPFTLSELSEFKENIDDVLEMKGRFLFLDNEYDVYGRQVKSGEGNHAD